MIGAPILTLTPNPALDISTRAPRVEPEHKLRCAIPRVYPGGGGINVARVVARLGGDVTALYPAGGPTGHRLQDLLAAEQVPAHCVRVAGDTRESFTVLEEQGGREYRFVMPGPTLTPAEWRTCLEQTVTAAAGCAYVVASGSLPPGVALDGYAELARRLTAIKVPLVLDTSGTPLALALEVGVFLFKPSLRELQEYIGSSLADTRARVAACRSIIGSRHAQIVALSLGDQGALLVTKRHVWQAPPLTVQVASTVGAGDTFLGGLVLGLACGKAHEECLRHAMAASAASLRRYGTELCHPKDVAGFMPNVVVEPVQADF